MQLYVGPLLAHVISVCALHSTPQSVAARPGRRSGRRMSPGSRGQPRRRSGGGRIIIQNGGWPDHHPKWGRGHVRRVC